MPTEVSIRETGAFQQLPVTIYLQDFLVGEVCNNFSEAGADECDLLIVGHCYLLDQSGLVLVTHCGPRSMVNRESMASLSHHSLSRPVAARAA